jgi:hypothetical protein
MTSHLRVPDLDTSQRLLANLRRTRLEIEAFNLELAEISSRLELETTKQKQSRVNHSNPLL